MTTAAIIQIMLALVSNLPALESDAASLVTSLKSLFTGLQNGSITSANFQAQVSALLASASAIDAEVEAPAA